MPGIRSGWIVPAQESTDADRPEGRGQLQPQPAARGRERRRRRGPGLLPEPRRRAGHARQRARQRPGEGRRQAGIGSDAGQGDDCLGANPALVYARMTGWGQEGPLADRVGHDLNYASITGAIAAIGEPGLEPIDDHHFCEATIN